MSKAYEDEQKMLKGKLASITEQLRCYEEKQDNATHFIALIRAYTDIKELDAAMLLNCKVKRTDRQKMAKPKTLK